MLKLNFGNNTTATSVYNKEFNRDSVFCAVYKNYIFTCGEISKFLDLTIYEYSLSVHYTKCNRYNKKPSLKMVQQVLISRTIFLIIVYLSPLAISFF